MRRLTPRRVPWTPFLILIAVIASSPKSYAVTYVSNLAESYEVNFGITGSAVASSFTTDGVTYQLDQVTLDIHSNISSGFAQVKIRDDDGGMPGAELEDMGTITITSGGSSLLSLTSTGLLLRCKHHLLDHRRRNQLRKCIMEGHHLDHGDLTWGLDHRRSDLLQHRRRHELATGVLRSTQRECSLQRRCHNLHRFHHVRQQSGGIQRRELQHHSLCPRIVLHYRRLALRAQSRHAGHPLQHFLGVYPGEDPRG